jgi:hypothetical protein
MNFYLKTAMAFSLLYRFYMNNQERTLNLSNAKKREVMNKTKQVLAMAPVIPTLFRFVQTAGALEWKGFD